MILQVLIQMVKYAFGFPVVAMVSHIPVKSRMAVNYVFENLDSNPRRRENTANRGSLYDRPLIGQRLFVGEFSL